MVETRLEPDFGRLCLLCRSASTPGPFRAAHAASNQAAPSAPSASLHPITLLSPSSFAAAAMANDLDDELLALAGGGAASDDDEETSAAATATATASKRRSKSASASKSTASKKRRVHQSSDEDEDDEDEDDIGGPLYPLEGIYRNEEDKE